MRKGLSLIELIFTIVIIAIVFTVIPKIVLSLNKADSFIIRQDAMFNGISMMKMISKMPWDENNTNSRDILHVNSGNFECNKTTFRRDGAFVGSRTCEENLTASLILNRYGADINYTENDIGDFNNTLVEVNLSTKPIYDLNISVAYTLDDNSTVFKYDYPNKRVSIYLNNSIVQNLDTNTSNLKKITIQVSYNGNRGERKHLTQFNYTSSNIGQMILNKRSW